MENQMSEVRCQKSDAGSQKSDVGNLKSEIRSQKNLNSSEILKFCFEKGVLVDKDILNLFSETNDFESIKLIIEKIKNNTQIKILTKQVFETNKEQVNKFFSDLPRESQRNFEILKIKLGLSIEVSREIIEEGNQKSDVGNQMSEIRCQK